MEKGKIGGIRTPKPLNRLSQNLACVITLAIWASTAKFKPIAPVGASRQMGEISLAWFLVVFCDLWNRALFTWPKEKNFRLPHKLSLLCRFYPKSANNLFTLLQYSRFHPNLFTFNRDTAECVNTVFCPVEYFDDLPKAVLRFGWILVMWNDNCFKKLIIGFKNTKPIEFFYSTVCICSLIHLLQNNHGFRP